MLLELAGQEEDSVVEDMLALKSASDEVGSLFIERLKL